MRRLVFTALLAASFAFPANAWASQEKPNEKPSEPVEKIDPSVDRSLTGVVELIEAKDADNGKITIRSSGPPKGSPYKYIFQVDEGKTKLENADGKPLADGLKSVMLKGAEVRVEFVDERRNSSDAPAPGVHFARKLRILPTTK